MLDPDTTDQDELREGASPWRHGSTLLPMRPLEQSLRCDVLVVGAGITGAMLAEHLTARGHEVCLIDREEPGHGSTLASTAMLLWEIDTPLAQMTELYGFERAANIYRRSVAAVQGLAALAGSIGAPCGFRTRHSLYLSAGQVGSAELRREHELRARAGLPGIFLDHGTLLREFGFDREGAILSPGSADADPLALARALTAAALTRGARLHLADATDFAPSGRRVRVGLGSGHEIEADRVVLATGYVMPDIVTSELHSASASWALATPPQRPDALWRDGVLIWEASEDYLYARTTVDGRIIVGGEDEDGVTDRDERAALIPAKSAAILRKLTALVPRAEARADMIWSGAFGRTKDGLPLIGEVRDHPGIFAAYGYGGNGITFSFMASRMIAAMIEGRREPWFDHLAIDRPAP